MRNSVILIILILVRVSAVSAQTGSDRTSDPEADIAKKRAEMEALYDELNYLKDDYTSTIASLTTRRSELQVLLDQERLKQRRLEEALAVTDEVGSDDVAEEQRSADAVQALIEKAKAYVHSGIPFHSSERLAILDSMEAELASGKTPPAAVMVKLWNFIESEFALTGESGIYRQTITFAGKTVLADTARLGMVLLYFRTLDGIYGYAVPSGTGWEYRTAASAGEERQIRTLFDSLEKNIRRGSFELPVPWYTAGGRS